MEPLFGCASPRSREGMACRILSETGKSCVHLRLDLGGGLGDDAGVGTPQSVVLKTRSSSQDVGLSHLGPMLTNSRPEAVASQAITAGTLQ
jgi:hypothetical protein